MATPPPTSGIEIDRLEQLGPGRVLASLRVNASGRASGIRVASEMSTTNLYDLVDGRVRRIRIFLDRRAALAAADLPD